GTAIGGLVFGPGHAVRIVAAVEGLVRYQLPDLRGMRNALPRVRLGAGLVRPGENRGRKKQPADEGRPGCDRGDRRRVHGSMSLCSRGWQGHVRDAMVSCGDWAGCSWLDRRYTACRPSGQPVSPARIAMPQALKKSAASDLPFKDPSLFRQQCYINGKWVDAESGKTIEVNNPATGEVLGTVPSLGAAETRRAIEAANAAWPAWRKKTAKERANILRKWFNLM